MDKIKQLEQMINKEENLFKKVYMFVFLNKVKNNREESIEELLLKQ